MAVKREAADGELRSLLQRARAGRRPQLEQYEDQYEDQHEDPQYEDQYEDRPRYEQFQDRSYLRDPRVELYAPAEDALGLLPTPACTCPAHGAALRPSARFSGLADGRDAAGYASSARPQRPHAPPHPHLHPHDAARLEASVHTQELRPRLPIYADEQSHAYYASALADDRYYEDHDHYAHDHALDDYTTARGRTVGPRALAHDRALDEYGTPQDHHTEYFVPRHARRGRVLDDDELVNNDPDEDELRHARLRISVSTNSATRVLLPVARPTHHRSLPSSPESSATTVTTSSQPKRRRTTAQLAHNNGDTSIHTALMLIPANGGAALLEKRGQFIQAIAAESRCILAIRDVPDELADDEADTRLLRLEGRADDISLAIRLVIERIREFRSSKRDPYYAPMTRELVMALPDASVTRATLSWMKHFSGKTGLTTDQDTDSIELLPVEDAAEDIVQALWLVRKDQVGRMMGSKGAILSSIRAETGAAVHVADASESTPGATERLVTIEGNEAQVLGALEAIRDRAEGRPQPIVGSAGRTGQYFAIPYHTAGFLIGLKGDRAREIAAKTGARLQIPSQLGLPLGCINRLVHVQGTRKQIEHAARVIGAKLRDYLSGEAEETDAADDVDELGGSADDEDPVTLRVVVASKVASSLLDSRGRLVRSLMAESGAYMRFVQSSSKRSTSRVCLVSGDLPKVLIGVQMLLTSGGDSDLAPRIGKRKRERDAVERARENRTAVDQEMEKESTRVDVNHELPTKRGRPSARPTGKFSTNEPSSGPGMSTIKVRRLGSGAGGGSRKVQVVSTASRRGRLA